jgi:hypothetical protein
LLDHLGNVLLEQQYVCRKARMDVFISCVAQGLLLYRVVLRRFMFRNARFQQGLRRRRWRRLRTSSFGEEKVCNHPGLYQVEQGKREDVVRKASKT